MRLAYADPPYPGKAHLYPENTEVDHAELIGQLCEYDGWALSTDEVNLAGVLALCPVGVRVLAWCRKNSPPLYPYPVAAWEPVLCSPARKTVEPILSYFVCGVRVGFTRTDELTGQKPPEFCEWVIRCMGAEQTDTLVDVFPGTGSMSRAWETFTRQTMIRVDASRKPTGRVLANRTRRANEPFEEIGSGQPLREGNGRSGRASATTGDLGGPSLPLPLIP